MSKSRNPGIEPEIRDERIKPKPKNTFDHVFGPCNRKVCEDNAKILLFSKDMFCEILSNADTFQNIITTTKNSCLDIERPTILVGFYIMPNSSNLTLGGNFLQIQPIYAGQSGNNFTEFLQNPIVIGAYEFAEYNSSSAPFVFPQTLSTNNFSHKIFQFNDIAIDEEFMKAYISWYELKCIIDHCDYIGICGSVVMTGNFGVFEEDKNSLLQGRCNTGYFTYRIIGYKRIDVSDFIKLPEGTQKKLKEEKEILLKSNQILKDGGIVTDFKIPTETWATPCPPMWRPN